jgi:NTP pyrophosphatase (non-canonical NTP hydrolase)
MPDATTTIASLKQAVKHFADERAWEPFHNPKNLTMCLAVEAAELMEHFLWVDAEASRAVCKDAKEMSEVADEIADVANLLLNLCNTLNIDLSEAIRVKMVKNASKYPLDKYYGRFRAED